MVIGDIGFPDAKALEKVKVTKGKEW